MKKKPRIALIIFALIYSGCIISKSPQSSITTNSSKVIRLDPQKVKRKISTFKTVDGIDLQIEFFFPPEWKSTDQRTCALFFHGGGWRNRDRSQFYEQSRFLASRGIVAGCVEYRLLDKNAPVDLSICIEDAKTAVHWTLMNRDCLGINKEKLILGGGSAGGHLALAAAICPGFESSEDKRTPIQPAALLLYNPVAELVELTAEPRYHGAAAGITNPKMFCPTWNLNCDHNIPMILFYGTKDGYLRTGKALFHKTRTFNIPIELYLAEGQGHGFFNQEPWMSATTAVMEQFLIEQNLLSSPAVMPLSEAQSLTQYDSTSQSQ